jgi:hypothetical protein
VGILSSVHYTNLCTKLIYTCRLSVSVFLLLTYSLNNYSAYLASAFQSFLLGAGHPTEVGHWTRSFPLPTRQTSRATLNTAGVKCWTDHGPTEGKCVWEMHGVWGWDTRKEVGVVLREGYFRKHPMTGREVRTSHLFVLAIKIILFCIG